MSTKVTLSDDTGLGNQADISAEVFGASMQEAAEALKIEQTKKDQKLKEVEKAEAEPIGAETNSGAAGIQVDESSVVRSEFRSIEVTDGTDKKDAILSTQLNNSVTHTVEELKSVESGEPGNKLQGTGAKAAEDSGTSNSTNQTANQTGGQSTKNSGSTGPGQLHGQDTTATSEERPVNGTKRNPALPQDSSNLPITPTSDPSTTHIEPVRTNTSFNSGEDPKPKTLDELLAKKTDLTPVVTDAAPSFSSSSTPKYQPLEGKQNPPPSSNISERTTQHSDQGGANEPVRTANPIAGKSSDSDLAPVREPIRSKDVQPITIKANEPTKSSVTDADTYRNEIGKVVAKDNGTDPQSARSGTSTQPPSPEVPLRKQGIKLESGTDSKNIKPANPGSESQSGADVKSATTGTSPSVAERNNIITTPGSSPSASKSDGNKDNIQRKSNDVIKDLKTESANPKIISKSDSPKVAETSRSESVTLAAKIKDLVQQVVSTNTKEIVRVQAKEELVRLVESAVKKATFEGKTADLVQVVKQIIAEPAIKDSIRIVTGSTGDTNSIKDLKALLNQVALLRNKEDPVSKVDIASVATKRVEDIQGPVISKEAALQALVGILVDADKITSRLVKEVQIETVSKLSQIQSTVDELIKLRVEQFISLSVKGYGVDGATFKSLCQETITELANRYGLNDQQRALLNQILIQISESDFSSGKPPTTTEKDKAKEPEKKEVVDPNKKELTPKEIEALLQKEIETLEAFLKEREEIKRAKAEAELVNLLAEVIDETMSYKIDEDLEVIKTFTIKGQVIHQHTRKPIAGVRIYAGILGIYETDQDGLFVIRNIPQLTRYIIGADHPDYVFTPPYHSGTLDMSIELSFEATSSKL